MGKFSNAKERLYKVEEIYLDNSATTRPYDEVIAYMEDIQKNIYGNPSSLHRKGIEAEKLIKKARSTIADSLKVDAREIYFTSGGTESNNLAIRGFLQANLRSGRHIITTAIEHPSVLEVFRYLSENGYKVDYLSVDQNGQVNLDELKSKISEDTALISIIYVNNEIGTIQPVDEIVRIKNAINRNTVLHMDAVQAYGKTPIYPKKQGIDMLSLSSHKIHGPKGVGALYISNSIKVKPIIFGGGQESSLRSGTENTAGIAGFGLASEITFRNMDIAADNVKKLRKYFVKKLREEIDGVYINSPEDSSPYILNASFSNVRSEVLLHHLEAEGIYVSTGSACSSHKNMHSHVLSALGFEAGRIDGAIRFSFSNFNNEHEIDVTVDALKRILPRIQIKKGGKK